VLVFVHALISDERFLGGLRGVDFLLGQAPGLLDGVHQRRCRRGPLSFRKTRNVTGTGQGVEIRRIRE
jgi:hypothetical protein